MNNFVYLFITIMYFDEKKFFWIGLVEHKSRESRYLLKIDTISASVYNYKSLSWKYLRRILEKMSCVFHREDGIRSLEIRHEMTSRFTQLLFGRAFLALPYIFGLTKLIFMLNLSAWNIVIFLTLCVTRTVTYYFEDKFNQENISSNRNEKRS